MIRYPAADLATLEAAVDAAAPTWRARANQRTAANRAAGQFINRSSIWSEVKPVFMRLQHRKCAYCERPLAGELAGLIEQDVEHFRPKSSVRAWPLAGQPPYSFSTGAAYPSGYYWLAYALDNYAAACKPCNSARKSDYFPIAANDRGAFDTAPPRLNAIEAPLLIYPLGPSDEDPENIIVFEGIVAVPVHANGRLNQRAVVTIDFFALNDREELWSERFRVIREVWTHYDRTQDHPDPDERTAAEETLRELTREDAPHASCARSFMRQIEADPLGAFEMFKLARKANQARPRPA
jgi:5-methylcytosine-specific restriction endonuclease McrA